MKGGCYGDSFMDSEYDADRIKPVFKFDPIQLVLLYQKHNETDWATDASDADWDVYGPIIGYNAENFYAGALMLYYRNRTNATYDPTFYRINPYFKGDFGPVNIKAELDYRTGDYADYDAAGTTDLDYDAIGYMVDASMDLGEGNVGIGYAHANGEDANDNDLNKTFNGGEEWEPLLILTGNTIGSASGNLNTAQRSTSLGTGTGTWGDLGFDMVYLYGSYPLNDTMSLNAIGAWAAADETNAIGTNVDDEIGMEFDVGFVWKIMDGLTYDLKAGYFIAGDLFKLDNKNTADSEDCFAMMHSIKVTF
jgi:hypothetical protein